MLFGCETIVADPRGDQLWKQKLLVLSSYKDDSTDVNVTIYVKCECVCVHVHKYVCNT